MGNLIQCNTELLLLNDDMKLSSELTFDTKLVANVGQKVYSVARFYEFAMKDSREFLKLTNAKSKLFIDLVTIVGVNYVTKDEIKLYANKDDGEQIVVKQPFLYGTLKEAEEALRDIQSFYSRNPNGDWTYKKYSGTKYEYELKFPVKPNDILMKNNICYLVKGIVALIYNGIVSISYEVINNIVDEDMLGSCNKHDYNTIKNKYSIEKL